MISAIVLLYRGSKPSQDALRRVVEELMSLNCCTEIIDVKHVDEDDIVKGVIGTISDGETNGSKQKDKRYTIEFTVGTSKLLTVKLLKEYLHLTLKDAKDIVDVGRITTDKILPIELLTALFDNDVAFINAPKEYLIEYSIYLLNKKFSGNTGMFNIVKYLQEYESGERSDLHRAIHAAVDIIYEYRTSISEDRLKDGLYNMIQAWKQRIV